MTAAVLAFMLASVQGQVFLCGYYCACQDTKELAVCYADKPKGCDCDAPTGDITAPFVYEEGTITIATTGIVTDRCTTEPLRMLKQMLDDEWTDATVIDIATPSRGDALRGQAKRADRDDAWHAAVETIVKECAK